MTPEEGDRCGEPGAMLEFLYGRASDRRLHLFACACCRRIWPLLNHDRSRAAVDVAEAFADGRASEGELEAACAAAKAATTEAGRIGEAAARAAAAGAETAASLAAVAKARDTAAWAAEGELAARKAAWATESQQQARLLRCIVGSPFCPPPVLAPALLAWRDGAARRLAESIDAACRFEDLPVLADLLEEAGCADAALLGHLRGPGPHVLGCHALDAVLGKS
jgi:hypothetical protein